VQIITDAMMQHERSHWLKEFDGLGYALLSVVHHTYSPCPSIPFGPINNIQQTFEHPQAVARGTVVEVEVTVTTSSQQMLDSILTDT
jgi:succinate---hydroxymethylglutarate CoA-transferase